MQEPELFLFSRISRSGLWPIRHPVKLRPAGSFFGEKGERADNVPPSITVVKNAYSYTATLPPEFMACTETTVPLLVYFYFIPLCNFFAFFPVPDWLFDESNDCPMYVL